MNSVKTLTRRCAPLLVTLAGLAVGAPGQDSLEEVLSRARAARGADVDLVLDGAADHRGTPADLRLQFARDGRWELQLEGRLGRTIGCDGREVWRVDSGAGVPYPLDLWMGDVEMAVAEVWAGRWFDQPRPLQISPKKPRSEGDTYVLELSSTRSSFRATLHLDRQDWLPRRLVLDEAWVGANEWTFDEYDTVAGRRVAMHVANVDEAGTGDSFRARSGRAQPAGATLGRRPLLRPRNVVFDKDAPAELRVRRAPSGWLLVRPLVDGKDVGWFVFDTGAPVSTIESETAERLGLPAFGEGRRSGAGPRVTATILRQGTSLSLGPLELAQPVFVQMDLRLATGQEPPLAAGVLGWDVLIHGVVEIDMAEGAMAIHHSEGYELRAGTWHDTVLHLGHPHVRASFESAEGLFRLDTGAGRSTCLFHAPAVERLGLLDGRSTRYGSASGAGGRIEWREGRIDWFEIAGHRIDRPRVRFSLDRKGALADPNTLGNLGGVFLEPFVLAFDYRRQRIGFVPRP